MQSIRPQSHENKQLSGKSFSFNVLTPLVLIYLHLIFSLSLCVLGSPPDKLRNIRYRFGERDFFFHLCWDLCCFNRLHQLPLQTNWSEMCDVFFNSIATSKSIVKFSHWFRLSIWYSPILEINTNTITNDSHSNYNPLCTLVFKLK